MEEINDLIRFFQVIIVSGSALRITQCIINLSYSNDESSGLKKRIKNALIFVIVALTATETINLFFSYFGGRN